MSLIEKILGRPEFQEMPPVLVDVGASSGVHHGWKAIAKHSICIAFDADDRGMEQTRRESDVYKELYVYNRALTSGAENVADFYLTQDPPCSSMLPPSTRKLAAWEFADRFTVAQQSKVPTTQLKTVLAELKLDRVDWFKVDTQGTDLRLFRSLGERLVPRVLVAELEPGLIDAYEGEDKLWDVMRFMHDHGFWMSDISVKGTSRIHQDVATSFLPLERKYMFHLLRTSPGWAEIIYLNSFLSDDLTKRDHLLGWVCASIRQQYGFALEVASRGKTRFGDSTFDELVASSRAGVRRSYLALHAYVPLLGRVLRRWKRLGFRWAHPTGPAVRPRQKLQVHTQPESRRYGRQERMDD